MRNYDYHEAMLTDIINTLQGDDRIKQKLREFVLNDNEIDFASLSEMLHDELWVCDAVTGNLSGSYFFSRYKAKIAVIENVDLLHDALHEFCVDQETILDRFINDDWEYFDVTIRCYILPDVIADVVGNWFVDYLDQLTKNA